MRSERTVRHSKTSPTNCPRNLTGWSLASTPLADSTIDRDTAIAGPKRPCGSPATGNCDPIGKHRSHHRAENPPSHRIRQARRAERPTARTRTPSPTTVADVAVASGRRHHADPALHPAHVKYADEELQLLEVRVRGRSGRRPHGIGQPEWRHHRHVEGRGRLHQ